MEKVLKVLFAILATPLILLFGTIFAIIFALFMFFVAFVEAFIMAYTYIFTGSIDPTGEYEPNEAPDVIEIH